MKTKKALLDEVALKIFEVFEDEILLDGDTISVSFMFDSDGDYDVCAEKHTSYEIDLEDDANE